MEMGKMKKQLAIVGIVLLFIAGLFIAINLTTENVKAESASGTWVGPVTDQTGAADFYYTATLSLSGESSVYGSLELECTDVYVKISGFEGSQSMIGTVTTADVDGTMSGSSLTLNVYSSGGTFTFYLTVSGEKMTGGSQYTGAAGETNTWTFDLTKGGGGFGFDFGGVSDLSFLMGPAAAIGLIGGSASLAASFLPAPRGLMGFRGRTRNRSPRFNRPYVWRSPPPVAAPPPPPPPPPIGAPAARPAPLLPPAQTLVMPLQEDLGPTKGDFLVPWDAPMQCVPTENPPGYPYPDGTNASMRCPYCGQTTLSPFTTGWFCTNAQCPARRELLQKGYTHHQYNNMTWRP
jgi:hypothetical protein